MRYWDFIDFVILAFYGFAGIAAGVAFYNGHELLDVAGFPPLRLASRPVVDCAQPALVASLRSLTRASLRSDGCAPTGTIMPNGVPKAQLMPNGRPIDSIVIF